MTTDILAHSLALGIISLGVAQPGVVQQHTWSDLDLSLFPFLPLLHMAS